MLVRSVIRWPFWWKAVKKFRTSGLIGCNFRKTTGTSQLGPFEKKTTRRRSSINKLESDHCWWFNETNRCTILIYPVNVCVYNYIYICIHSNLKLGARGTLSISLGLVSQLSSATISAGQKVNDKMAKACNAPVTGLMDRKKETQWPPVSVLEIRVLLPKITDLLSIYLFHCVLFISGHEWFDLLLILQPETSFSRALSCYRTTRHMNPPPQAIAGTAPKMCLPPLLNLESSMGAPGNGVPHQPQAQKRYIPQLFSNNNMKGNGHPFYFRIFHDFPWHQPALGPFSVARSGKGVKLRSQAMHKGNLLRTVATIRRPYITVVALIYGP